MTMQLHVWRTDGIAGFLELRIVHEILNIGFK